MDDDDEERLWALLFNYFTTLSESRIHDHCSSRQVFIKLHNKSHWKFHMHEMEFRGHRREGNNCAELETWRKVCLIATKVQINITRQKSWENKAKQKKTLKQFMTQETIHIFIIYCQGWNLWMYTTAQNY